MSALLEWTNRAMLEEDFALAVLGGDRHRYHAYGYEHAGRTIYISIGARGAARLGIPEVEAVRYEGTRAELVAMTKLYEQQPYGRVRLKLETPWIYQSSDFQVWTSGQPDAAEFAYLVTQNGRVVEWGGQPRTALGMVPSLAAGQSLRFRFPDFAAVPSEFRAAMGHWSLGPSTQIQVVNVDLVLEAFSEVPGLPSTAELKAMDVSSRTWALFGGPMEGPLNFFLPETERV